jgi:hypothetical protein
MDDEAENLELPMTLRGIEYGEFFRRIMNEDTKNQLLSLQETLQSYLSMIIHFFPTLTGHDYQHALRTLSNLESLFRILGILDYFTEKPEAGEEQEHAKQQEYLIILICACVLHDIGMGPITEEDLDRVRNRTFSMTSEEENEIRKKHHDRSYDWITKSRMADEHLGENLCLNSKQRETIGQIARAHRKVKFFDDQFFIVEENKDYAFFGAALRLADQMDLSPNRVKGFGIDLDFIERTEDRETRRELLSNIAEKTVFVVPQKRELVLKSEAPLKLTMETLHALDYLTEKIEGAIGEVRDVPWQGNAILPRSLNHQFGIEGLERGYNPQLRSDYRSVWNYLSRELYAPDVRDEIPIREAVANAIDTGLLLELMSDETAHVLVRDKGKIIVIEDNGTGINHDVIENHLKVLGSSYYSSPKFTGWLNTHNWTDFSVVGRFGIGTFSYLLTSGSFTLDTVTSDGEAHRVLFTERFGVAKELPKDVVMSRGTRVQIPCETRPKSWASSKDLEKLLARLFPRPSIQLSLVSDNKSKPVRIGYYERKEHSRIRQNPKSYSIHFEDFNRLEDGSSIGFTFRASIPKGKSTFRQTLPRLVSLYQYVSRFVLRDRQRHSYRPKFDNEYRARHFLRTKSLLQTMHRFTRVRAGIFDLYTEGMAITHLRNMIGCLLHAFRLMEEHGLFGENVHSCRYWIDLKSNLVKLEITKKTVFGLDAMPYINELEKLLKHPAETILSHDDVPWEFRETFRLATLSPFQIVYPEDSKDPQVRDAQGIIQDQLLNNFINPESFMRKLPVWDIDEEKLVSFGNYLDDDKTKRFSLVALGIINALHFHEVKIDLKNILKISNAQIKKQGLGDHNLMVVLPWSMNMFLVTKYLTRIGYPRPRSSIVI